MKKILVTMLALSLAAVSTVDAKRIGVMGGGPIVKNIEDATANLQNAPMDEKEAAFAELVDILKEDESLQDLVRLQSQRSKIVIERDNAHNEAKAKKSGFGLFFQSGDYKQARDKETGLNKQLTDVNKKIAAINRNKGTQSESNYISHAMTAIGTIMGIAVLERYFGGETGYVGRFQTYGKGKVKETWNKMPSMRSTKTEPAK